MNSLARTNNDGGLDELEAPILVHTVTFEEKPIYSESVVTTHSGLPVRWTPDIAETLAVDGKGVQLATKRVFDVTVALIALCMLAPLLIIVAIAVKMTSAGPVMFRQDREGLNGKYFQAFKFRSMTVDQCDATGVAQTEKNDPRVTAVGRFIRQTSIDELPQLLNVLRGDMSLVGPRPHVTGMRAAGKSYRELVPYYDARLAMKPGITGWAQANGLRGSTADARKARERIDHDIAYIQNFSVLLDLKILVLTVAREFITGSGD